MSANAWLNGIGNKIERIGCARVFRFGNIIVIGSAVRIENDILQNRTAPDRAPDFRLLLFRKFYAFRIASPFEIKNSVITPAMFVIPDKRSRWIGGKVVLPVSQSPKQHRR